MSRAPDAPPRRRLSADERREQLMAAAVAVIAEHGFRAASADAIVARAGVSKGLLWHYFADVDDLLAQTARRTVLGIARAVGEGIDLAAPAPEVLRAAIRAAARIPERFGDEHRALQQIVPNLRTPEGAVRLTLDDYGELHAAQEAILRRGQAEGDLRSDLDPRILARSYQATVDTMIEHLRLHPDEDADAYSDQVAEILLGGITIRRG